MDQSKSLEIHPDQFKSIEIQLDHLNSVEIHPDQLKFEKIQRKSMLELNAFIGGVIGGLSGILMSYPLDTIKVRMQTNYTSVINSPHLVSLDHSSNVIAL